MDQAGRVVVLVDAASSPLRHAGSRIRRRGVMNRWQRFDNRIRGTGPAVLKCAGRQVWLDRPSYRLEHALTFLFATLGRNRDRVSNALHGTWLGHPLHPALTSVPTGAVATALVLD